MSFPTKVPNLSTKEAIMDAILRSVYAIDTNDRALFDSSWALNDPNICFDLNGDLLNGMDAIHSLFDVVGPLDTTHTLSNFRITNMEEKKASMTSYAMAQHYKAGEGLDPNTKNFLTSSMYWIDVIYDETDGLWKMTKWAIKIVWLDGDASVIPKPQ